MLDLGEQKLRADAAGLEEVLTDRCEADRIRDRDIVVADDREIGRYLETQVPCSAHHTKGLRVAGGEDRRGRARACQESQGEFARASRSVGTKRRHGVDAQGL